jgi:hypothetical protein
MADLTITPANVKPEATTITKHGTAGATLTAGQSVYIDPTDGTIKPARANAPGTATIAGVALNGASSGQPIAFVVGGEYTPGATVVVGTVYVLSAGVAGGIAPYDDLTTGNRVSILGVATAANKIKINIINSGVAIPA